MHIRGFGIQVDLYRDPAFIKEVFLLPFVFYVCVFARMESDYLGASSSHHVGPRALIQLVMGLYLLSFRVALAFFIPYELHLNCERTICREEDMEFDPSCYYRADRDL